MVRTTAWSAKQLIGYAGCVAMALGVFLPFKHLMVRDVSAFAAGFGIVIAIGAIIAAVLVSKRRYTGASFSAAAVAIFLALQYATLERAGAFYSLISKTVFAEQTPPLPLNLDVHFDVGFYVIGIGALCVVGARLYRGGDAAREHVGGGTYAVPKSNGHVAVGEREFERGDRTE